MQHTVAAGCSRRQGPPALLHLLPTGQQQELGADPCLGVTSKATEHHTARLLTEVSLSAPLEGQGGRAGPGCGSGMGQRQAGGLGARAGLGQGMQCFLLPARPRARGHGQTVPNMAMVSVLGRAPGEELATPPCRSCASVSLSTNPFPRDEPGSETLNFYQC